uniref:PPM-type phosphatase domain-containing protein n=1 Tax=Chromera velia CCMP2878 TaxID=1169474 RepID=A0A0G4FG20_9ALVE|eukprot:Cvel_16662.t1-p1 / transcript=Cvel_16662.t1 / gene=Cvel_16662 / organism=Chromera_velia_CCMP2878 / gene_product=hypothetical protein / transcript_product=hypothetical protein / location=Cvel_scaffold1292:37084-45604(-) / protein_length=893 / sequence_SO=supercontig / SO=protein_coding / is_pseudo=false
MRGSESNEDSFVCCPPLSLFCLFDGHRGRQAVNFLESNFLHFWAHECVKRTALVSSLLARSGYVTAQSQSPNVPREQSTEAQTQDGKEDRLTNRVEPSQRRAQEPNAGEVQPAAQQRDKAPPTRVDPMSGESRRIREKSGSRRGSQYSNQILTIAHTPVLDLWRLAFATALLDAEYCFYRMSSAAAHLPGLYSGASLVAAQVTPFGLLVASLGDCGAVAVYEGRQRREEEKPFSAEEKEREGGEGSQGESGTSPTRTEREGSPIGVFSSKRRGEDLMMSKQPQHKKQSGDGHYAEAPPPVSETLAGKLQSLNASKDLSSQVHASWLRTERLSKQHLAQFDSEISRLEARLQRHLVTRRGVNQGLLQGQIRQSRAFGDFQFKDILANSRLPEEDPRRISPPPHVPIVRSDADYVLVPYTQDLKFVIAASAGFWALLSSREAAELADRFFQTQGLAPLGGRVEEEEGGEGDGAREELGSSSGEFRSSSSSLKEEKNPTEVPSAGGGWGGRSPIQSVGPLSDRLAKAEAEASYQKKGRGGNSEVLTGAQAIESKQPPSTNSGENCPSASASSLESSADTIPLSALYQYHDVASFLIRCALLKAARRPRSPPSMVPSFLWMLMVMPSDRPLSMGVEDGPGFEKMLLREIERHRGRNPHAHAPRKQSLSMFAELDDDISVAVFVVPSSFCETPPALPFAGAKPKDVRRPPALRAVAAPTFRPPASHGWDAEPRVGVPQSPEPSQDHAPPHQEVAPPSSSASPSAHTHAERDRGAHGQHHDLRSALRRPHPSTQTPAMSSNHAFFKSLRSNINENLEVESGPGSPSDDSHNRGGCQVGPASGAEVEGEKGSSSASTFLRWLSRNADLRQSEEEKTVRRMFSHMPPTQRSDGPPSSAPGF